jgi:hypothetical protein
MAKRIVYHGTIEGKAPHEHGYPFHAGTYRAANDRLDDEMQHTDWNWEGNGVPSLSVGQIHAYEISDKAPTSRRTWEDPMFYNNESRAVPENSQTRIYPYKNEREDRGSTSFVVPSAFVGNHVKHLNTQQFLINAIDDRGDTVYNAMSTMVGGRKQ